MAGRYCLRFKVRVTRAEDTVGNPYDATPLKGFKTQ